MAQPLLMGCVSGARPGAAAQRAAATAAAAAAAGGGRAAAARGGPRARLPGGRRRDRSAAAPARVQGCGRVVTRRNARARDGARALSGRAAGRALSGARAAACTRAPFQALARPSAGGRGGARRIRQRPAGRRCGLLRRRRRTGARAGADAWRAHAARRAPCPGPNKALTSCSMPGWPSLPARPGPRMPARILTSAVDWGLHPRAPCACAAPAAPPPTWQHKCGAAEAHALCCRPVPGAAQRLDTNAAAGDAGARQRRRTARAAGRLRRAARP